MPILPPRKTERLGLPGGFYDYHEGGKNLWPELGSAMSRWIESAAEQPSVDIVKRRYLFAQCLEAARCLEQGVITDIRDGDPGVIMAVGFPAFTGGPFTYIDNYGVADFVRDADELSRPLRRTLRAAEASPRHGSRGSHLLFSRVAFQR